MDEIIELIQQGHTELYEELWNQLKRLITWYANRYYFKISRFGIAPGGVEVEDLIQSGYIALVDAVNNYHPIEGASFTHYLGYHLQKMFRRTIGRTDKQLADPLNYAVSLDTPIDDDDPEGETQLDRIPDPHDAYTSVDDRIFLEELHDVLENAINILSEREARAVRAEFFEGGKQKEIAEELGVSISRVYQLSKDGVRHIRHSSAKKQLERFLGEHVSYYKGNSVSQYKQTRTSGVERAVLHRDYLRDHYCDFLEDEDSADE